MEWHLGETFLSLAPNSSVHEGMNPREGNLLVETSKLANSHPFRSARIARSRLSPKSFVYCFGWHLGVNKTKWVVREINFELSPKILGAARLKARQKLLP